MVGSGREDEEEEEAIELATPEKDCNYVHEKEERGFKILKQLSFCWAQGEQRRKKEHLHQLRFLHRLFLLFCHFFTVLVSTLA